MFTKRLGVVNLRTRRTTFLSPKRSRRPRKTAWNSGSLANGLAWSCQPAHSHWWGGPPWAISRPPSKPAWFTPPWQRKSSISVEDNKGRRNLYSTMARIQTTSNLRVAFLGGEIIVWLLPPFQLASYYREVQNQLHHSTLILLFCDPLQRR